MLNRFFGKTNSGEEISVPTSTEVHVVNKEHTTSNKRPREGTGLLDAKRTVYNDKWAESSGNEQSSRRNTGKVRNFHKDPQPVFSQGQGRMYSGEVTFDDVYKKFTTTSTPEFRNKFEPPHVPDLADEELSELLSWERQRIRNKEELMNDKIYEFIVLVTGGSNTPLSRALPTTTVPSRGGQPALGVYRAAVVPTTGPTGAATTAGISPGGQFGAIASPPYTPGVKRAGRYVVNPAPVVGSPTQQRAIQLARERDEVTKYYNNTRLTTGYPWIEKPEVIGKMTIAPNIYFAANRVFTLIKSIRDFKQFHILEDFHPFIYSNLSEVRVIYADLTRLQMALTEVFFPSRTNLENTKQRIDSETWIALQRLSMYTWNDDEKMFSKKQGELLRQRTASNTWNPFSI